MATYTFLSNGLAIPNKNLTVSDLTSLAQQLRDDLQVIQRWGSNVQKNLDNTVLPAINSIPAAPPNPATTVQSGTAFSTPSAVGTDTTYAREDHQHGTPPTPVTSISAGANISVSASTGAVTISAASGTTTDIYAGTGISLSGGPTGSVTIYAYLAGGTDCTLSTLGNEYVINVNTPVTQAADLAYYSNGHSTGNTSYSIWGLYVQNLVVSGTKPFYIEHPVTGPENVLVFSATEGPRADLIYRDQVTLVNGTADINLDEFFGMTAGTFEALTLPARRQVFLYNVSGDANPHYILSGSVLTITCSELTAVVNWMVMAERGDAAMRKSPFVDTNGQLVNEHVQSSLPFPAPVIR